MTSGKGEGAKRPPGSTERTGQPLRFSEPRDNPSCRHKQRSVGESEPLFGRRAIIERRHRGGSELGKTNRLGRDGGRRLDRAGICRANDERIGAATRPRTAEAAR